MIIKIMKIDRFVTDLLKLDIFILRKSTWGWNGEAKNSCAKFAEFNKILNRKCNHVIIAYKKQKKNKQLFHFFFPLMREFFQKSYFIKAITDPNIANGITFRLR